jgi:hypothetical protein
MLTFPVGSTAGEIIADVNGRELGARKIVEKRKLAGFTHP